jgi:hypothetical protein
LTGLEKNVFPIATKSKFPVLTKIM